MIGTTWITADGEKRIMPNGWVPGVSDAIVGYKTWKPGKGDIGYYIHSETKRSWNRVPRKRFEEALQKKGQ